MRAFVALALLAASCASAAVSARPKLVVLIAIDQFRYDYLTRFRNDYTGGLKRLLDSGAVWTNAHYEHFPTVTAIGHATMLSGATPSVSGIVGNAWYDRELGRQVTSVSDDETTLLGGSGRGASPRRLLVSTVGDELKVANGKSRVIGISSKDRSAVLPVGRMADGAYWFDTSNGNFVSSTFYFPSLPEWAAKFNGSRVVDQWVGKTWASIRDAGRPPFLKLGEKPERGYYDNLDRSPYSNELLVQFAQAAMEGEKLGADEYTDVLSISFSANDRVGHSLGPDSEEVHEISLHTDRLLGRFLADLDKRVGAENYVVVLTADHGVAPMPEVMAKRRMPGGRIPEGAVQSAIEKALTERWGEGPWVLGRSGPAPYFNLDTIRAKKLSREEVEIVAAAAAREVPHIYRVYTRTQLRSGSLLSDMIDQRVQAGFHFGRSSDLFIVSEPYWLFESRGTSHGTPYNYDSHVPVVFMGAGIRAGRYHQRAAVNDIAPTLAILLDVEPPSGSAGRVLHEMLE
ncbi:MAG TPA: alkaline phosphatase family protein [Bryobacteraceae bacterium]|nr:alkaline phosphatase family protein [Bryobacteraceae bacterium]